MTTGREPGAGARVSCVVERLGHRGDGIADGPVFIDRALPGEHVSGVLDGQRLTNVRIDVPSAHRVRPMCRHYKSCGGCQLQHAADDFVADWKVQFVCAALAAQGLEAEFRPIVTSPPRSRRRATLAVKRTKSGAIAGFHGRASDTITDIEDCVLVDPDILKARAGLKELALIGSSRKGALAVTVTVAKGGVDVSVSGGKPLEEKLRLSLTQIASAHGFGRLSWAGEEVVTLSKPEQQLGGAWVTPPPGAFLQATLQGEDALRAGVSEIAGEAGRIADLFSGCGTFALPLSAKAEVHAVESDADMLVALDAAWRQTQGLRQISTERRDLFRNPLLSSELKAFDAVVLDPPRAGAEAQVAELAQSGVPQIAYVSCNPISFARDAVTLVAAGYSLNWVQVVDQFRWSTHTELVASFALT